MEMEMEIVKWVDDILAAGLEVEVEADRITVLTRLSENPSRSNNGGDYDWWYEFTPVGTGVGIQEQCSCDFWQPQETPEVVPMPSGWTWTDVVNCIRARAKTAGVPVR